MIIELRHNDQTNIAFQEEGQIVTELDELLKDSQHLDLARLIKIGDLQEEKVF